MLHRRALFYLRRHRRRLGLTSIDIDPPSRASYEKLAQEVDEVLLRHDVGPWFPRAVDTLGGGFTADHSNDWRPLPALSKRLVFQARMTWFAAQVSERMTQASAEQFRAYALHGVKFLDDVLWDCERGGFFWDLTAEGRLPQGDVGAKHAYGIAFGIYACANVARVVRDARALDLAQRAFRWLAEHAHDPRQGGYHEDLDRDGVPIPFDPATTSWSVIDTPVGFKSANAHVHLLEAFTELYGVWRDALLRERLMELFLIVRDKMVVVPGCLNQWYTPGYRPVPALDSYGHDVEAAYLLVEAAKALDMHDDARHWQTARLLVDNALAHAFDTANGGFFDEGPAFRPATSLTKTWWVQAEALNALLVMHERFGAGDLRYWTALKRTWHYVRRRQIDPKHGGWHEAVWADNRPIIGRKGHNWKDPYHSGRALMNISKTLHRLANESGAADPNE
jgi:mannobiose 2-epimerase